ncbi:MAG: VCBS repeat-containing protein, partial [Desulfonatronovibrio sp.]
NAVKMPPDFRPTLIGQKPATGTRLFNPGSVQEVIMTSAGLELGRRIHLPPMTNVFNFNYLPQGDKHLIVTVENDKLHVFDQSHKKLYTTSEEYAGTNHGLEFYATMAGLGRGSDQDPDTYYIPTRLLPTRLGSDEKYYLLTQKHYAGLSRILVRQRNFSEGEIRALFWDDVGLNVHWSTRKIRASVTDFGLYDIDGDGQDELVVLVNTHPGITGMQSQDAIVLAYKMDFDSQADSK